MNNTHIKDFIQHLAMGVVLFVAVFPVFVFAEKIDSFDTVITVNTDSTIRVEETVFYDFEDRERHGIYRYIPIHYNTTYGNQSIRLSDISITDEKGNALDFVLTKEGDNQIIKIGNPAVLITGGHIYKISYTVEKSLGYFDTFDEIYWNATGDGWIVPIIISTVTVVLPSAISVSDVSSSCYFGTRYSITTCPSNAVLNPEGLVTSVFASTQMLMPGEGLTIAVGFPKGLVYEPTLLEKIWDFLSDNPLLFVPVFVFMGMFMYWHKHGRDPKGSGVIVAEYEAPDHLTSMEVAGVLKTKIGSKEISAEIIYLATKGFLKITRTEEKKFFMKHTDYDLSLLKHADDTTSDFDKKLLTALFGPSIPTLPLPTIKLSSLKNRFHRQLPDITHAVYDTLTAKGYYSKNPQLVLKPYIYMLSGLILALYFLGDAPVIFEKLFEGNTFQMVAVGVVSFLIILAFGHLMPKKTQKGAEMREKILGLKEYLQIAEKDRLNFHNAPDKNPELFEALLPYAMVFGVEKAWAKEFEGICTSSPSWYSDPYQNGMFSALILTNSLSGFSSVAATTLSSAPGRSSGSGGGGFSGGGGGGGGGGSW